METATLTRPKPTRDLIYAITSGNKSTLAWIHHGLDEAPLGKLYPCLNLDELLVFAGISWRARDSEREQELYRKLISGEVPDFFCDVLAASKGRYYQKCCLSIDDIPGRVPMHMEPRYEALNPFKEDLKERLRHVEPKDIEELRKALRCQTLKHVFEDQYFVAKRHIRAEYGLGQDVEVDPARLKIMVFQNARAKNRTDEKVAQAYVNRINQIIGGYPRVLYEPGEYPKVQQTLFLI